MIESLRVWKDVRIGEEHRAELGGQFLALSVEISPTESGPGGEKEAGKAKQSPQNGVTVDRPG